MLYQDYKKKVNKFVRVLKFVSKYKIAILSALTTILLLVASFMITKGWIYGEELELTDIEYGNKPLLDAQAIFSDVIYEFSEADKDEWSQVVPTDMGKYKMRVIANGLFGKKYSDEQFFSIVPRKIVVSAVEDTIIYGESPSVTASLAFTDKIFCDSFTYENSTLVTTNVTPDKESIAIKNEADVDVTSYYDITVQPRPITFMKRDVTVTVGSYTGTYDGKPLEFPVASAEEGGLVFGDDVVTMVYPNDEVPLINIGSKINNGIIIIKRGTVDVTHQYNISVIPGTLTLTKRPLVVEIGSGHFEYDGKAHSYPQFTYNETTTPLPEGHYLDVNPSSKPTEVTNVSEGEVVNVVDVRVYNKAGEDVTGNFAVTILPEDGAKLWITPKKITVKTESAELIYNGQEQKAEGVTVVTENGLIDGHKIVVVKNTAVKDVVAAVENKLEIIIVDEKNNNANVTDNYDIEYIYGTIEVKKKDVFILSDSLTDKFYNGQAQSANGVSYPDKDKELCPGHTVEITYGASVTDCDLDPESKGVENTFSVVIKDADGQPVTDNYNVIKESGWLKLKPLPVKVITGTDNRMYDGTPFKVERFEYADGSFQFVDGQRIDYVNATEIVNVIIENGAVVDCANKFELKLFVGEEDKKEDKTFNYVIEYEYGRIRLDKRPVVITSVGFSEKTYYDGEQHRNDGDDAVAVSAGNKDMTFALVDGHKEKVTFRPDSYVEFAKDSENDKENAFDVDGIFNGNEDVTYNYDISVVFGTLHLEKRPVKFESSTLEATDAEYDGLSHSKEEFAVSPLGEDNMGLVSGHTPHPSGFGSIVNVKESGAKNTFVIGSITDSLNNEVIENYEIGEYTFGTLNVSPREITLESGSDERVYDGLKLIVKGLTVGGRGMADGQTVIGSNYAFLIDVKVDSDGNAIAIDNTFDFEFSDGTVTIDKENYDVTFVYGKLKLNKRQITLTSQNAEKTYDDTPLFNDSLLVGGVHGLAGGQKVVCKDYAMPVNVLRDPATNAVIGWKNTFDCEFAWDDGTPVSSNNYQVIKNEDGLLTIYEREVTITVDSKSKEYDGVPLMADENGYVCVGLVDGHTVSFKLSGSITTVQTATISHGGKPQVYKGTEPKTDNYKFVIIDGTLEVTKRPVYIKFRNQSKQYDGIELVPLFDNGNVYHANDDTKSGIASGDLISMYFGITGLTEPGYIEIRYPDEIVGYIIKDGAGEDVTFCYDVVGYQDGSLEVTKRKLTISVTGNYKEFYDGSTITSKGSTERNFLYSLHDITYAVVGSQTDVGTSYATVENGSVRITKKGTNEDASQYYEFDYTSYYITDGELTVEKKRAVTITTASATLPYTGQAQTGFETYVIEESDELAGFPMQRLESPLIIFDNQEIVMPGIYQNKIKQPVEFYIDGTTEPTTQNYDVTVIEGNVSIGRIYIDYINTSSASKVYDAEPLTSTAVDWGCSSIPTGYEINVVGTSSITNVGKTDNAYRIELRVNGVLMSQEDTDKLVGIDPANVTYGVLEVTPIVIDIASGDVDKWYYGEAPDSTWTYSTSWQDRDGFVLDITPGNGITFHVGPVENSFKAVLNYNGVPVDEENCVINTTFGTVKVYSKGIKVKTDSGEFLYDGTPKRSTRIIGTPTGDIDDFHYVRGYDFNITDFIDVNLEGYDNVCNVRVWVDVDGKAVEMTEYYEKIEVVPGKITIKKRDLTIGVPNIKEKWVEGKEIRAENVMYDINGDFELLNTECYSYGVQYEYVITCDLGAKYFVNTNQTQVTYSIPLENFFLVRVDTDTGDRYTLTAEEMARNFNLTSKEGVLLLTDKLINIAIKYAERVYNGQAITYTNSFFRVLPGELPDGHTVTIEVEKDVNGYAVDRDIIGRVNVGQVDLDKLLEYLIVSKRLVVWYNGQDVTDTFVFKFISRDGSEAVPLTVKPCTLIIEAGSKTEYFKEGEVLRADEYVIISGEQEMRANGDKIDICTVSGMLDEPGTKRTHVNIVVIVNEHGENVTKNYEIIKRNGNLEFIEPEE